MTSPTRWFAGLIATTCVIVGCGASSTVAPSTLCTLGALHGPYGSQRNGTTAPGTLVTAVGLATFDGNGNLAESQTMSTNGTFSSVKGQVSRYTVNADCTGTLIDSNGTVVENLVVVHDGDEVLGESTVPGSSSSLHYERITGTCSLATIAGTYGVQRNGVTKNGTLLAIGTTTFDGVGGSVASQVIDRAGVFGAPTNQSGPYSVNPDCTGSQMDATGLVVAPLVIVAGGDEILAMSLTAGNNVVVHFERVR